MVKSNGGSCKNGEKERKNGKKMTERKKWIKQSAEKDSEKKEEVRNE